MKLQLVQWWKYLTGFGLLALALVWLASGAGADRTKGDDLFGNDLIRLQIQVGDPDDPFAPMYQRAKAAVERPKVRRGEVVRVTVVGTPKAGFHTYPIKRVLGNQPRSKMTIAATKGAVPLPPIVESEPQRVEDTEGAWLEYDGRFTWSQDVLIAEDAPAGELQLPIKVSLQVCNEKKCTPVDERLAAAVEVSSAEALPLSEELAKRLAAARPAVVRENGPSAPAPATTPSPPSAAEASEAVEGVYGQIAVSPGEYKKQMLQDLAPRIVKPEIAAPGTGGTALDLWSFIVTGIFWGGVSLITPCVFPMIPITVSYFLKQSEKEHHRPLAMAAVYSLTIVVVLTLAAAFLLSVFRWLSVHPVTNYFLGGLFIFFALSLFGMYEIELPNSLARFTSSREGQGGLVGTMFMALTFTIISFACVAPFLGGFGGTAAAARPLWHNLLGGLAFSCTFAAPFFLLALFPTLLRAVPKSGAWLNAVKVVMGFLELAAAFKFMRAAELTQTAGAPSLFTYDLVLGLWIALCVLSGLYLIGAYRLPHDTPQENIGVPRLLFSAAFLCLAFYLLPALFKGDKGQAQRPGGSVYAWIDSFLLPEMATGAGHPVTANLPLAIEETAKYQQRTGKKKLLFLDFTGVNCSNCRFNESSVFSRPDIQHLLKPYTVVQLYTDIVPKEFYLPELVKDLARCEDDAVEVNRAFERALFDSIELPLYAVLEVRADKVYLVGGYDESRIQNPTAFAEFLRHPEQWAGKKAGQ